MIHLCNCLFFQKNKAKSGVKNTYEHQPWPLINIWVKGNIIYLSQIIKKKYHEKIYYDKLLKMV